MASAPQKDREALAQYLQSTHEKLSAEGFNPDAEKLKKAIMPKVEEGIRGLLQRAPEEVRAKFTLALEEAKVLPNFEADLDGLRTAIAKCIEILDGAGAGPVNVTTDAKEPPSLLCCICLDGKPAHEGIKCCCDELVCRECLDPFARTFAGKDLALLERDDGRLKCPGSKCSTDPYYYPDAELASKFPDDFHLLIKVRLQVQERKIRLEAKLEMQQMHQTQAPIETDLAKARKHIEELLNLACTRCGQAYVDFNGCAALECSGCGGAFCAWCGLDAGDDAHDHVARCDAKPPLADMYFGTEEEIKVAQKRQKRRLVREYLYSQPAAVQQQLREEMKTHFAECGVDAEEEAWPEADGRDQDVDDEDYEDGQELWVDAPEDAVDDEDFEELLEKMAAQVGIQQAPVDGDSNLGPVHAGQQPGAQAPPHVHVHNDEQQRPRHRREGWQGPPPHQQRAWADWVPGNGAWGNWGNREQQPKGDQQGPWANWVAPGNGAWAKEAPPGNREQQPKDDPWRRQGPAAQAAPGCPEDKEQISKDMTGLLRHGHRGFDKCRHPVTGFASLSDLARHLKYKYTEERMVRVVSESFNSTGARFELSEHAGARMIRSTCRRTAA